jgi:hypothetical protein
MADNQRHKFTKAELRRGVPLGTALTHVIEMVDYRLTVRLGVDPSARESIDDIFTLIGGTSPSSATYRQTKTARDDAIKGDKYLDLVFTGLIPELKYWLEVDPGRDGTKYFGFSGLEWMRIKPGSGT